ncbi:MAG: pseudouridine synthase, partial [Lachnoanaerobaculum saburreum]
MALKILYEDNDIIVVIKPRGVFSQSSSGFEEDMVSLIKKHLGKDSYIGVVHRLDKPVYGIMVYGKNKKATGILCNELRKKNIRKIYEALVEGVPSENIGKLRDFIKKDNN